MELLTFLGGIAVLTGIGMFLAWPREEELDSAEYRAESARGLRRRERV
ncbi:hypothetical protein DFQ14_102204 [Halopolyspora algeriensis]|uniref:Uncharacterized protein n=1 Tax=Halopolyspora algeriensis TaxID=1500506 RepID=A0A368VVN2_9ACTN|nr:hypothetical protein [Halopolyspora algeriensis]RCW45903.1 hypothetical protein DFQ14_102204 [Halopolyspora algeriensis]TQM55317.1 hypothetical protein FHU43_0078 [Halopolyspora algeriensis]